MAAKKLIPIKEFCAHHNISTGFILDLQRNGMVRLVTVKKTKYIPENTLQDIEKIIRLYSELQVNIEGIQTIFHLLASIEKKEAELRKLRNQLAFYIP